MHHDSEIEIRQITFLETYPVRRAVLYPKGPEDKILIPNDKDGIHFGAFVRHTQATTDVEDFPSRAKDAIAVISLSHEFPPAHLIPLMSNYSPTKSLRFRKFACLEQHQRHGFGSHIFQHVLDYARNNINLGPGTMVWCDARRSTQGWYLKRGMQVVGEAFYKGDIEYIVMNIHLNARH
ncbi:hypothetical protein K439DRAFT_1393565 [Ramaria rubella]|nr:hypothetical protein K439DRAFT_1393565 [Ramaria rubella]